MEILISDGLILDNPQTGEEISRFFASADNYWGPYQFRQELNIEYKTIIKDAGIETNWIAIRDSNDPLIIGLGIFVSNEVEEINKKYVNNISIKSAIINAAELSNPLLPNQVGPLLILSAKTIKSHKETIDSYRLGKNKNGKYVIYLHNSNSESNVPIKIPRDDNE